MRSIYEEAKTPYKYGLVVAPQDNHHKIDCPTVFHQDGSWYMTYVCYNGKTGTDGRGYETWLAKSEDLLHWQTLGRVLSYKDGGWDMNQRGGFPSLIDMTWGGTYNIGSYKGKRYMTYIGGSGRGYEAVEQPLSIGLAYTSSDITKASEWQSLNSPILSYNDKQAQWWEQMTQYKSLVYQVDKSVFGYPFVMYYNAGGKDASHPKGERIGIALSKDMLSWKRYEGNPVFAHDSDGTITGDAQIVKMGDTYVMFYFSAFNPTRKYNAYNTFAASKDMVHWQDWEGQDLVFPSKPYDELFAHKSWVIKHKGVVYHFYCAVNKSDQRGIAVATSRPMGKSEVTFPTPEPVGKRTEISLNSDWQITFQGVKKTLNVPFNLDDYYGYLQKEHGNLHGEMTAEKRFFVPQTAMGKQCFLRFEGVGTYADVELNGKPLGHYAIGRLTETIDITKQVAVGKENILKLHISHPKMITDMPWVCGGCSSEWGFSEGSQPFGIYRPVTLEVTDKVRIEPFGTHIWSNQQVDSVFVETEVRNYGTKAQTLSLVSKITDKAGKQILRLVDEVTLQAGSVQTIKQSGKLPEVKRWTLEEPYLYSLNSIIKRGGKATDELTTPYGFRSVVLPKSQCATDKRLYLNGKPVFVNGVCEYEHLLGAGHAFCNEQIEARVKEMRNAGFNAMRDAHQPHNLHYNKLLDEQGMLWWPQFSAHIWYDTKAFKDNFKAKLRQWVKERRNSPSLILWGLQNESTLPKDFAMECSQIIRQMDPTAGTQRLITTCNGGTGTDWNVVQNWSGTYGGNPDNYGEELKQPSQILNGEYGSWRTFGNHGAKGYTEEKQCDLLEKKLLRAEEVKDSVMGHFLWLLNSHDNPGRRQPDEALRRIDKVGPVNYKGLFTPWEEPVDAYYMYKAHYTRATAQPFVYLVPALKDTLRIYSNCDSVRLTTQTRQAIVKSHADRSVLKIKNPCMAGETLRIEGISGGRILCHDIIDTGGCGAEDEPLLKETAGWHSIYSINCGGDEHKDRFGGVWLQDTERFSSSWGRRFKEVSPYQASQTYKPLLPVGTLFKTARFGRGDLKYRFPLNKGTYLVELFFIEPWYGKGGSDMNDEEGMRIFSISANGKTIIKDLDIWAQAGYGKPYKRSAVVENEGDTLTISFPEVKSSQAIISAIRISSKDQRQAVYVPQAESFWAKQEQDVLTATPDSLLPKRESTAIKAAGKRLKGAMEWTFKVGVAKVYALRFRYNNPNGERKAHVRITDQNGTLYNDDTITLQETQKKPTKRRSTSITTSTQINAGTYKAVLQGEDMDKMLFDDLTIE